jgi:hypothetical protein
VELDPGAQMRCIRFFSKTGCDRWRPRLELLGRAQPRGKIGGAAASLSLAGFAVEPTAPAAEEFHLVRLPEGEELDFVGQAALVALGCAGQRACRRWDRAVGGERREKVMGLMREKHKQRESG